MGEGKDTPPPVKKVRFFMVWRKGGDAPTKIHETHKSALKECWRLANENPGHAFFVMQACGKAKVAGEGEDVV